MLQTDLKNTQIKSTACVFFFFAGDGESDPTVSRFFLAAAREPTRRKWRRCVEETRRHFFFIQKPSHQFSWVFRGYYVILYLCDVFVCFILNFLLFVIR